MSLIKPVLAAALLMAASAAAFAADDTPAQDMTVVATVNGAPIHRYEIEAMRDVVPEKYRQLPMDNLFPALLNGIVDRKIVAGAARAAGLADDDTIKRNMAILQEELLQRAHLRDIITERLTEGLMQEGYREFVDQFPAKPEVKASHILLETEEAAKEVIKALDDGGDFAELAKIRSTGPSGPRGGDLGYFTKEAMVPEFAEVAFAMAVNSYTKTPVKTQFGWHVIMVLDTRMSVAPSFEEIKDDLQNDLAQKLGREYISELTAKAEVKKFNLDGSEPAAEEAAPADAKPEQGPAPAQ